MVHKRFPHRLAFILNNPVRKSLHPPQKLISRLDVGPNDVVVDFGCGPGFFTVPLAKVAGKAIGVDVSSRMLERAASYAKRNGVMVELMQSNGTEIKLPDVGVDLILLAHVFHDVEHKPRVLSEFLRILKPSGRLVVVEKTRGGGILTGKLGPPIIDEAEVIQEMTTAGFTRIRIIPHEKDTMIIGQKVAKE